MRTANTYQSNQWPVENFWNQVAMDEEQEFRAAGGDRAVVRKQVIDAIVTYAIPAGNA